jgi:hypothetical protein
VLYPREFRREAVEPHTKKPIVSQYITFIGSVFRSVPLPSPTDDAIQARRQNLRNSGAVPLTVRARVSTVPTDADLAAAETAVLG